MPRTFAWALLVAAWLSPDVAATAQDYPARPVRVIIPLGAGGGGDVFARVLADELQKRLGQPFVVENRTGGGLNIGTRACAEAPPDGYTICVLSSEPVATTSSCTRRFHSTRRKISSRSRTCFSTRWRWRSAARSTCEPFRS